jgi:hypothetical protein
MDLMSVADWNQGLLLSVLLIIVGGMLLIGASSIRERLIAVGTLAQAVVLAFVTNGAFHGRSDLPLAAIALASLYVLWSLLVACGQEDESDSDEVGSATDSPSPKEVMRSLATHTRNDHSHQEAV